MDAKELFILNSKKQLLNLLSDIISERSIFQPTKTHTELYYMLSQIQITSSLFKLKEIHSISIFLMKRVRVIDDKIQFKFGKDSLFYKGIESLFKAMDSYLGNNAVIDDPTVEKKFNLLILDRDTHFTNWLKESLQNTEYDLNITTSENIISNLYVQLHHAILINMSNPNAESIDSVRKIRNEYSYNIPIIAMNQSNDEKSRIEILSQPITHVISKPFSINELLALISNSYINKRKESPIIISSDYVKEQRQSMLHLMEKEWMRFQRFDSIYSIVIFKVITHEYFIMNLGRDYFRAFKQLMQVASQTIRQYDEIGVWSKGSFILLLPATPLEGATIVAKRIKKKLVELENPFAQYTIWGTVQSEHHYKGSEKLLQHLETQLTTPRALPDGIEVPLSFESVSVNNEKNNRLLIIDDDLVSSNILFNNLKGWDIHTCSDGSKALDTILELQPDIILSETKLNDLDGFSLLIQLKQIPSCHHIRFCFLSKQNLEHIVVRAFQIGAVDYFFKPFNVREIEARLERQMVEI